MRLLPKFVVGFAGLFSLGLAAADSVEVDGFRYHLANTDCTYVIANRAFGLRIMDWDFPVPAGYDFRGFQHLSDRDSLWFQKLTTVDPKEYIENHPGTSVSEAVRKSSEEGANIYYFEEEEAASEDSELYDEFEAMEWQGLSMFYRASSGGRQMQTTVHQVIVQAVGSIERLHISSTNVRQLTDVIACATKTE